uniref:Uncharacterized protein n=1 Tax=Chromera velia CCMP2878 TaxID=1169474 RepID=A0A0K6S9S1_9ALVE|eukprot:Cvel_31163.t2-p1 / transcript=Cvel_31163.t2 / gene=Cvel_31163 / organism=Chromera_velia_CCMP2878 / gene_product=hypothetical protein / transcript_product=hypothetical protein / location=Cvel_scaffold4587:1587-6869(-) / protein_length=946 / sequence_SO=supercontig / SO=protein_coding / is_pseudo=false
MESSVDPPEGYCVPALSAILSHTGVSAEVVSDLVSDKAGFGTGWLILQFIRQKHVGLSTFLSLDLKDFSLGAGKLRLLLSCLPEGLVSLETLKGGAHVCTEPFLFVLQTFLQSFRGGTGRLMGTVSVASLKNLNLSKCDLSDSGGASLLHSLTSDLAGESGLERSAFSEGALSRPLRLDVSNNPLGPSGVATLARGLSAAGKALPLQTLKLSKTTARAEGVKALSASLKEGRAPSLQVLDLGGNNIKAEGVGDVALAGALGTGTLSFLKVLILEKNSLAVSRHGRWDFSGATALFANQFPSLQELDLGGNDFQGITHHPFSILGEAVRAGRLLALQRLNLSDTHIRRADMVAVFNALAAGGAPSLQALHLGSMDRSEAEALAAAFESNHLSEMRDVRCWGGMGVVMRAIANEKVPFLRNLQIILPAADEMTGRITERFRKGGVVPLEDLELVFEKNEDNSSAERMRDFGRAVGEAGVSSLQKLKLSLGEGGGDEQVEALVEGLGSGGEFVSLTDVSVDIDGSFGGGGRGCRALGEFLSSGKISSLRRLELDISLGDSFRHLAEGLGVGSLAPQVAVTSSVYCNRAAQDDNVRAFAALLRAGKLPGLRKMSVGGYVNLIRGGSAIEDEAARELGEAFTHQERGVGACAVCLPKLEELEFDVDVIRAEEEEETVTPMASLFRGVAAGRGGLPSLHTLRFCGSRLMGESTICALSECIRKGKFPQLRNLDLSVVLRLTQKGMHALTVALCTPHVKSLRSLILDKSGTGSNPAARTAETVLMGQLAVAFSLGHLRGLEEFSFEGHLLPESLSALCVGLESGELRCLRSLKIPTVPLGEDEGTSALCKALTAEKMPALRYLKLRCGCDKGLKKLVKAWEDAEPPPVERLDLSGSSFGDQGAVALASLAEIGRLPLLWDVRLDHSWSVESSVKALLRAAFPNSFTYRDDSDS